MHTRSWSSDWLTVPALYLCAFMLIEMCSVSVDAGTEKRHFEHLVLQHTTLSILMSTFSKGDFWEDAILAGSLPVRASLKRLISAAPC